MDVKEIIEILESEMRFEYVHSLSEVRQAYAAVLDILKDAEKPKNWKMIRKNDEYVCPRCGYDVLVDHVDDLTNYCPDCGLNLSGGGEGGEE